MIQDPTFPKNAGRILSVQETADWKKAYSDDQEKNGHKDFVRSEFFGIDHIRPLLSLPGCVGIRVYHARQWEDDHGRPTAAGKGIFKKRVLLTPVDENGKNIPIPVTTGGLKDQPSGGGNGGSVGDGRPCPQFCNGDDN